ncbi:MAG: rhomboid family intramembrane serine protease [Bacteroidetes bacterium]|nr:rhomboid family intramembrane serine protease [Bacteroidota bacterium]
MSYRDPYNPFGGGFTYMPPVIKNLLIINIAVFVVTFLAYGGNTQNFFYGIFALWSLDSGMFMPWQLVTYMFMHGGFMHILFNMFGLWMFGVELENYWGSKRFLTYYMITGVGAGLLHLGIQFFEGSGGLTVGASGAIYGVLLAFGMMFPNRIIFVSLLIPMPAKYFVLLYGAIELFSGLTRANTGVAHFAHLGGMIWGFFLIKYWQGGGDFSRWWKKITAGLQSAKPKTPPPGGNARIYDFYEETRQTKPQTDAQRLDEILDKIAEKGYSGLTAEEKDFLFTYSRKN